MVSKVVKTKTETEIKFLRPKSWPRDWPSQNYCLQIDAETTGAIISALRPSPKFCLDTSLVSAVFNNSDARRSGGNAVGRTSIL